MKTTIFLSLSLLFSLFAHSQDIPSTQVPPAVIKSFNRYFPNTPKVEWEKKGNQYEAEFDIKRTDHKALFESNGKLIVYKRDIHNGQLPAAIKHTIKQQYPNYKIDDAERIARNGHVYYQVALKGPDTIKLVFTPEGKQDKSQGY
ncbi:MAG: PepSY-like domain-containing protein [Chitinophagaceae bacterium]|nr:PepSY-like domain-containing protein [Chitinophagaceae bacterium]